MKQFLLTFFVTFLFSQSAWALSLSDAKAQGLIGERSNGYLGIVVSKPSPAIRVLVEDINRKRRAAYQGRAQKAGVNLKVIELRIGERLRDRASAGQFVQDSSGQWRQK